MRWRMLVLVLVTRTTMGFQFQAVPAVSPLLQADLGFTFSQLGLLTGIYLAPGVFFALPGGILGRRFGEKRLVVLSLGLMTLGGLTTAQSSLFAVALTGRLLAGIGAVLMNILLARMVADWFAEREMATAMAITQAAWPIGLGIATASLGVLAMATSWRIALVVTALIALAGAIFGVLFALASQGAFNRFFQWRYDTTLVFVRVTAAIAARAVAVAEPLGILASLASSWGLLRQRTLALTGR